MKVLHLPFNMASQLSTTVRVQRDLGVDARGLVVSNHKIQDARGLEIITETDSGGRAKRSVDKVRKWYKVLRAIQWADVIHWHYAKSILRNDIDLRWAALLRKPRFIEFWGSDIRVPEIAAQDNPYLQRLYAEDSVLLTNGMQAATASQIRFAHYGFAAIVPGVELSTFVQPSLFQTVFATHQRLVLAEFEPHYPDPARQRLLVVHAPSKKPIKGTEYVLRAVEMLQQRHAFDFRLIHDVSHVEAIAQMQEADIVLDQFIIGDHGLAAVEAMALGKPTLCFIKPAYLAHYPNDFPLVNADPDNLVSVLEALLVDGQRRHAIGRASRRYVEQYHDAHGVAKDLIHLYRNHLSSKSRRK